MPDQPEPTNPARPAMTMREIREALGHTIHDPAASGVQPDARSMPCACDGQTLLQVHTAADCYDIEPARPVPDTERLSLLKSIADLAVDIGHARHELSRVVLGLDGAPQDMSLGQVVDAVVAEYRSEVAATARLRAELDLAERVKRSAARDAAAALTAQIAAEAELEQARATTADVGNLDAVRARLVEAVWAADAGTLTEPLVQDIADHTLAVLTGHMVDVTGELRTRAVELDRRTAEVERKVATFAAGSGGQAEDGAQS